MDITVCLIGAQLQVHGKISPTFDSRWSWKYKINIHRLLLSKERTDLVKLDFLKRWIFYSKIKIIAVFSLVIFQVITNIMLTSCWIIMEIINYVNIFQCFNSYLYFVWLDLYACPNSVRPYFSAAPNSTPQNVPPAALQGLHKTSPWNAASRVTKKIDSESNLVTLTRQNFPDILIWI